MIEIDSLDGRIITCPICHEEDIILKLNKKNKPLVTCKNFGSTMNYNTPKGEEYIKSLVSDLEDKVDNIITDQPLEEPEENPPIDDTQEETGLTSEELEEKVEEIREKIQAELGEELDKIRIQVDDLSIKTNVPPSPPSPDLMEVKQLIAAEVNNRVNEGWQEIRQYIPEMIYEHHQRILRKQKAKKRKEVDYSFCEHCSGTEGRGLVHYGQGDCTHSNSREK